MSPAPLATNSLPAPVASAEDALVEAIRRASRHPQGRIALVLHLSRLAPPAPRPHHRRIARALLQDCADLHEGQVFALRNGDMVLMCRATERPAPPPQAASGSMVALLPAPAGTRAPVPASSDPATLPRTLSRLLSIDAPDPARLVTVWRMDRDVTDLCAYASERRAESIAAPPPRPEASIASATSAVMAIGRLVAKGNVADVIRRQTAVAIHTPRHAPPSLYGRLPGGIAEQALRPFFRELGFSVATLEARCRAPGQAAADPFLLRHLAQGMDQRMLDVLRKEIGGGSPFDVMVGQGWMQGVAPPVPIAAPLHINLTLPTILSERFFGFAAACRERGASVGVEVSIIEACADPASFAAATKLVRAARMTMVLDGVSHLLLLMTRGANLRFDLLKLDWSPLLPDLSGTDARALQDALEDIGPQRVVLHHVDNEAAMRWGLMYGIRKFQGRHIEAILGASRMKSCPLAAGCTARQCIERAAATGVFGRSGCGNTVLLDAGHDPDAAARATLDTGPGPRSAPRASAGGQNMAAPT